MLKLMAPRDLEPIPAIAAAAFVALAIFAWTERTILVDPEGLSVPYWPWKLWQICPLLMGLCGVWWVWLSTRRVPWGAQSSAGHISPGGSRQRIQRPVRRLSGRCVAHCQSVVHRLLDRGGGGAMALWTHCGASGRGGFCGDRRPGFRQRILRQQRGSWQILDPLRMLTSLAWAAGASQANVSTPESGESSGDG